MSLKKALGLGVLVGSLMGGPMALSEPTPYCKKVAAWPDRNLRGSGLEAKDFVPKNPMMANLETRDVIFILDNSGSMGWYLDGRDEVQAPLGKRRVDYALPVMREFLGRIARSQSQKKNINAGLFMFYDQGPQEVVPLQPV